MSEIIYLIWSNKHDAWWKPDERGYTTDQTNAGRYAARDAQRIAIQAANGGRIDRGVVIVAAPENHPGFAS